MSQQKIKQQARRMAREVAERRRVARAEKERRMTDLAEQVMVALGERDQAVAEAEARAGAALREWTEVEGQTLAEMVEWCDETLTAREAARLRRLAGDDDSEGEGDENGLTGQPDTKAEAQAGAAAKGDVSGGLGGGSTAG